MASKHFTAGSFAKHRLYTTIVAYVELTRMHLWPLGSDLVFWPCAYGLLMASVNAHELHPFHDLCIETVMFAIGATLLHSKSCILSDICDQKFDGKVERTKNRPLVSGRVSLAGSWVLFFVLLSAGLCLLSYANRKAALYGVFGVVTLHFTYPLMKRYTWWPQMFLGFAINWGIFVAWFSVTDSTDRRPLYTMYAGLVCWTIYYDSIYACQDRADDAKAGVKSTALLFGAHIKSILRAFALAFIGLLILAGVLNGNGAWFFVVSCGGAGCHLLWQQRNWNVDDPADCAAKFKSNGTMGAIIWLGLFLDYLFNGGI
ncbi:hypothetical protein NM688_g44 [Phlebia brevispora]|uniref:Uncharacterized protein n=1 Tax=Phlebia brevispora TaxID=194682 RepID=A0ACC1TFB7_9APHY|nr:hypothetical protein NM688_g44 [Phlebia brevispora]